MATVWQIVDSSTIGGIERHMALLTESLLRHGIETQLVLYQDHGANPWIDQLDQAGIKARHLEGTFGGLVRALRQDRPVLVHSHGYKANILSRFAARLLGISSVSTFHMGERPVWPVSLYAAVDAYSAVLSERIAVSAEIQKRLPYSSTLIANFIALPAARPEFAAPPQAIGFVGRLSHEKGPDYFCELARRANRDDVAWHVFGDGPMRVDLEARYGDCVTFHGMVTDMATAWPSLGLLVMPSRAEGLPLAALEALAAGIPIVGADVGDLGTVIVEGETGWLCPAHDLETFSRAIAAWLDLDVSSRLALRESAWRHVERNFSERNAVPKLLAIYARLGVEMPAATT